MNAQTYRDAKKKQAQRRPSFHVEATRAAAPALGHGAVASWSRRRRKRYPHAGPRYESGVSTRSRHIRQPRWRCHAFATLIRPSYGDCLGCTRPLQSFVADHPDEQALKVIDCAQDGTTKLVERPLLVMPSGPDRLGAVDTLCFARKRAGPVAQLAARIIITESF